jgi:hypothetical protein
MSADDLMTRIDAARDRLREAREEALAATGGIKGIIAASLILEWEASKVTYELKDNHRQISADNRAAFMREQRRLAADPSSPLHGLLDDGRYHAKPVALQAGHTVTRNGLVQALSGELETFALEEAIPNNYDSRAERAGQVLRKTVLDIGGHPVELTTARIIAGIPGLVDNNTRNIIANAPERPGVPASNSLFNASSIPDAAGSSQLRGILRGGSKALGPLGAAVDLYYLGDAIAEDGGTFGENTRTTVGGIAGGWGGAAAGAAIGSLIFPGVGTVVGGIIGGVGGGLLGESIGGLF